MRRNTLFLMGKHIVSVDDIMTLKMKFFLDNLFLSCDEGLDLGGGEFA